MKSIDTKGNLFKGQAIISNKAPYNKPLHPTCREGILNTTGADEEQCLKLDSRLVRSSFSIDNITGKITQKQIKGKNSKTKI